MPDDSPPSNIHPQTSLVDVIACAELISTPILCERDLRDSSSPPSTSTSDPVWKDHASEHIETTLFATSSADAMLRSRPDESARWIDEESEQREPTDRFMFVLWSHSFVHVGSSDEIMSV